MLAITVLLAVFLLPPTLLGYIANTKESPYKIFLLRKRARNIKQWIRINISKAAFVILTFFFYLVGALIFCGVKFNEHFLLLLLSTNCLAALAFLYHHYKLPLYISRYRELIRGLLTPLAIGLAALSKVIADKSIAELSGLPPQDLPGAQILLTLVLQPFIVFIGFSLLFGYMGIILMTYHAGHAFLYDIRRSRKRKTKKNQSINPHYTITIAVFFAAILALTLMQKIVSKSIYEPNLRKLIAFSSFTLPTTYCGLSDAANIEVAPMSDGRAGIAIPDKELGIRFELISCQPAKHSNAEISASLEKIVQENK